MNKAFSTLNPFTNEKIKDWTFADSVQIDSALNLLNQGFLSWQHNPAKARQKQLFAVVAQFEIHKEQLAISIVQHMGKPIFQARAEVQKTIEAARVLCEMDLDFLAEKKIDSSNQAIQIMNEPLGVIVGIMPWNFPFWQSIRMIFPTLLAGNTVLLKSSEITPEIGLLIQHCFDTAIPRNDLFQHVMFSHEQTELILSNPLIGGISLTGSTFAGQAVAQLAGKFLKKAIFELGGSDPYLILNDAHLKFAAKKVVQSRMNNCGQVCISAKRVLVHESQLSEFLKLCQTEMEKYTLGDPMDESTKLGPQAHVRFQQKYTQQIQELSPNCEVFYKAEVSFSQGAFVSPMILVFKTNPEILRSLELFGPALIVLPYETEEQAIQIANSTIYGLGAAVFSQDIARAQRIAKSIVAGQISINDFVKSDVHLPFGGFKSSGIGRELGTAGFLEFTQTKVISI